MLSGDLCKRSTPRVELDQRARGVVRLGRDRLTAILATPTPTQRRALDLLGVTPIA
jgi:hypothetical protein